MKKLFLTIVAFFSITTSVMADGHIDSVRYLTTRWKKNWFISADATANWWHSSMTTPEEFVNDFTRIDWRHPTIGFSANFGKWINHKTAVRVVYANNRINSHILGRHTGLRHIQYLYGDEPTIVESVDGLAVYNTSMRYHNLRAEFMVSPIDFFQGYYNPDRIWSPVLYLSTGGTLVSNDFFITQSLFHYINYKKGKLTDGYDASNFELSLGAGLLNNFRISEHFDINLDIAWVFQRWTIDSWTYEFGGHEPLANLRPKRFDNMYTASLGLTYYFSRVYDLCAPDTLFMETETAPNEAFMEIPPCDTVTIFVPINSDEMISYPFSIFFHCDSYQLMSNRDLVNLNEIANVAKEHNYKIRLRGSCDSATATPSYNQTLSENRCRKIMTELMKMGVPEDRFILVPVGGVKELDPTQYDRRVLIELVKEP